MQKIYKCSILVKKIKKLKNLKNGEKKWAGTPVYTYYWRRVRDNNKGIIFIGRWNAWNASKNISNNKCYDKTWFERYTNKKQRKILIKLFLGGKEAKT